MNDMAGGHVAQLKDMKTDLVDNKKDFCDKTAQQSLKEKIAIDINCTRISLDDPVMQHRYNFYDVILPRLRSFVEAVYCVRSCDDKRYRLLRAAAIASSGGNEREWWEVLTVECPWLNDCDTAFQRTHACNND